MLSNILLLLEYKLQLLIVSFKPNIDNYSLISNVDNMRTHATRTICTGASAVVRLPLHCKRLQNLAKLGKIHVRDLEWEAPLAWCDNAAAAWVMLLTAHQTARPRRVRAADCQHLFCITCRYSGSAPGDIHGSAVQGSGVHWGVAQLNPRNCKYNSLPLFR